MGNRSLYFGKDVKSLVLAACVMVALPMAAHGEPVELEQPKVTAPMRGADMLRAAILKTHNEDRGRLKLAPLIWDDALAKDANIWAIDLAKRNVFEHFTPNDAKKAQGENLWMGTRDGFAFEEMTGMWRDEAKLARDGVFPHVSTTQDWRDVAHFTQMVWPTTQRVGCALASNAEDDFLVCRYFPAGNRIGDRIVVTLRK
jgi:Cysteine-rich secretory protein family